MKQRIDLCQEYDTIQNLNVGNLTGNVEFEKGQVYSVIGRPGMGKTTVAKVLAESFATKGLKVLYINVGDITLREIYDLTFGNTEMEFDFKSNCIWHYDNYVTLRQFGDYVDYMSAIPDDIDMCIIDSFQFLRISLLEESKAHFLLNIAKKKNIPVIVFSHIARRTDCRNDKIPRPSDMTKTMCGDLRKVSRKIIALYRECYYCEAEDNSIHFYIYEE